MAPQSRIPVVAIDGPAGAGKSTVARRVAERLNYAFLDTGAMYRAATWRALRHNLPLDDRGALIESTRAMQLDLADGRIVVDGEDVTDAIRTSEVTRNIRALDGIPEIRERLGTLQRHFGESQPTVAEGRDMGTVVFPDAQCKIFLDAGLEERAKRRAAQLAGVPGETDVERIKADIEARDRNDRTRETAPLRMAPDAHRIDTTGLTIDEVVERIVDLVKGGQRDD